MTYRVILPSAIQQQISKLSPLLKRQIRAAFDDLAEDPHLGKALRQDLKGYYSYRVRHYRIVYSIHGDLVEIHVVAIGPRKVIYKSIT